MEGEGAAPGISRCGPFAYVSSPVCGSCFSSFPRASLMVSIRCFFLPQAIRSFTARPVGVAAKPPRAVSRSSMGRRRPTSPMASITSSTGMRLSMPAKAISAAATAFTAPTTLRLMHGTSTSPATGSQARPSRFFNAIATAWHSCSDVPPRRHTRAPAAMADALPISAWHPPAAPEIQAR